MMIVVRIINQGRSRSALKSARGMTLVEILLVLAIMAAAMGLGVYMMMSVLNRGYLRDEAMRLTSAIQYSYNQAALNNVPYRLIIDLDENIYYTEISESRVVMRQAADDYDEGLLPEEARQMEEQRRTNRRADFFREEEEDFFGISRRTGYQRAEDAVLQPRELRSGVRFYSVHTDNQSRAVTRGKVAIHFYPNGFQQQAIIVLEDTDSEAKFSLITEPLTGRVKAFSGHQEADHEFAREVRHRR